MASSFGETDSASNDSFPQDDYNDSSSDDGNSEHSGTKKGVNKNILRKATDDNFSYICEWNDCQHVSTSMNDFNHHVSKHRRGYTQCLGTDQEAGTGEYMFFCQWRECNANIEGNLDDFSRHVFYHTFHQYLKFLGLHIQKVENLNSCQLETTSRNVIPELPEKLMCRWLDCGLVYDNPYIFYSHVSHHCEDYPKGVNINVKCKWEGCQVVKKIWYKMKEHIRSHTQAKVVACPTCGSLFASNTRFIDHLKRQGHENEQKFECSHCNNRFGSERILRDHMRHHVNHYKCPLCDMTCHSPSAVRDHVRYRHSDERSFECGHCDYKAKTQTDLRRHAVIHKDKEKFYCNREGCDKTFTLRAHLFEHYLSDHESNKPYECHICTKRFLRGTFLTSHLMESHKYKWPSGHKRFRYALNDDGIKRLQTIRYESIEVSQQVLGQSLTTPGGASDPACSNAGAPVPVGVEADHALADSGEVREAETSERIQKDMGIHLEIHGQLGNRITGDTETLRERNSLTIELNTTDAKKRSKNGRGGKAKQNSEGRNGEEEAVTSKRARNVKKDAGRGNPIKRQKKTTSVDPVEFDSLIVAPCVTPLTEKTNSVNGDVSVESYCSMSPSPASSSQAYNLSLLKYPGGTSISVSLPEMPRPSETDPTLPLCAIMHASDIPTGLASDPGDVMVSQLEVRANTHPTLSPVYANLDRVVLQAQSLGSEPSPVKQEPHLGSDSVFMAFNNLHSQQVLTKFDIGSSSLDPYSYNVVAHAVATETTLRTPQKSFYPRWSPVKKEEQVSEGQPIEPNMSQNLDWTELTTDGVSTMAVSSSQPMYAVDPQNYNSRQYSGSSYGHDYDPIEDRGSPVSELYNLQMLGEVALNVQENTREGR